MKGWEQKWFPKIDDVYLTSIITVYFLNIIQFSEVGILYLALEILETYTLGSKAAY